MQYDPIYKVEVSLQDGTTGLEVHTTDQQGYMQIDSFELIDANGNVLGYSTVSFDHEQADPKPQFGKSTMPDWWRPKTIKKIQLLSKAFTATDELTPIPASYNVVTAGMHRRNGAMMGQLRAMMSKKGKPILDPGMPSMHGGLIEAEDLNLKDTDVEGDYKAGCLMAVCREMEEEFGVKMHWADFEYLGDVYDPDNSRFNHIYKVVTPYEDLVIRNHIKDLSPSLPLQTQKLIIAAIEATLSTTLECEGIGRITNMFKEDCERAMEIVGLTPISVTILQAFPQLIPPPRPAAE